MLDKGMLWMIIAGILPNHLCRMCGEENEIENIGLLNHRIRKFHDKLKDVSHYENKISMKCKGIYCLLFR